MAAGLLLCLAGCAPFASQPLDARERAGLDALDGVLARLVERRGGRLGEVAEALAEARGRDDVVAVPEDSAEGHLASVTGGRVYVRKRVLDDWLEGGERPAWLMLATYVHEGVHLTQGWIERQVWTDDAEEEAYRFTQRVQGELLLDLLTGAEREALGLEVLSPAELLESYAYVDRAFANRYVGGRSAYDRLERTLAPLLESGGLRVVYRGSPVWVSGDAEAAGAGRVRVRFVLPLERPEERAGTWTTRLEPSQALPEPKPGTLEARGVDLYRLLPGASDVAQLERLTLGYLVASSGGEASPNQAGAWNLTASAPAVVGGDRDALVVEVEGPGEVGAGRWRLGVVPGYSLVFRAGRLAAYVPSVGEGTQAIVRLSSFGRRLAPRRLPEVTYAVYDRRERRAWLWPLGAWAIGEVVCRGPEAFTPPFDVVEGYALPGWREHEGVEVSEEWGRLLDVEPIWDPRDLTEPRARPVVWAPVGARRAWVVVPRAALRTLRPRYRVAAAIGE